MQNNSQNTTFSAITPIVFPTALDFWLGNVNPEIGTIPSILENEDFTPVSLPKEYALEINSKVSGILNKNFGFLLPVVVAAPNAGKRHNSAQYNCVTLSRLLPDNSFVRLSKSIYIACPELCLVQAAKYLSFHKLVEVTCNMCGIYVIDKNSAYNQRHRVPITNIEKINTYIKKAYRLGGTHKLGMAMQYVTERSNSPVESKLATIMRLPFFHGGYGLPRFEMDFKLKPSPEDSKCFGTREIHTDFGWKDSYFVMEYDSNMTHLDVNQHTIDKQRSNIIASAGYNLFVLTASDVRSFVSLDRAIQLLRSRLGERQHLSKYDKYADLRWRVFNDLFRRDTSSYTDYFHRSTSRAGK